MLVLFIKGKLYQTDNFLPLIVAIKKKLPRRKLIIIYPSLDDYRIIKKNRALFQTLNHVAKLKFFFNPRDRDKNTFKYLPKKISGILSIIHRNLILYFFLYKKITILRTMDIPGISWLINFNRKFLGGKKVSIFIYPYSFQELKRYVQRTIDQNISIDVIFKKTLCTDNDILISSHSSKELIKLYPKWNNKTYKVFNIGHNLIFWRSWIKLLEKYSKNELNQLSKVFIFFPLATLQRYNKTPKGDKFADYTNLFLDIIKAIRLFDKNIQIILRPHPTSDEMVIRSILEKNKYKNILISYINPSILIKKSKFVIRWGTSTMDPLARRYNKLIVRYFSANLFEMLKAEIKPRKNKLENTYNVVGYKNLKENLYKLFNTNIKRYDFSTKSINENSLVNDVIKEL